MIQEYMPRKFRTLEKELANDGKLMVEALTLEDANSSIAIRVYVNVYIYTIYILWGILSSVYSMANHIVLHTYVMDNS